MTVRIKDPIGVLTKEEAGLQSGADTSLRVDASGALWIRVATKSLSASSGDVPFTVISDEDGDQIGIGTAPLFIDALRMREVLEDIRTELQTLNLHMTEITGESW